jgi:sugar/nucleoside kinase (ribokinase family)
MILDFGYIFTELDLNVPKIDLSGSYSDSTETLISPGGRAFNQAVAAARMGAKVSLIGAIGDDLFGKNILHRLQREGITGTGIIRATGNTGILTRIRDVHGRNLNVASIGANTQLKTLQVPLMAFNRRTILMLQDDVPEDDNLALLKRACDAGAITIMNLAHPEQYQAVSDYVDFLIIRDDLQIPDHQNIVRFTTDRSPQFDSFFAEDCFCGSFAACIQAGMTFDTAYTYAHKMAHLAGAQSMNAERFPYLDQVMKALPENQDQRTG